MGRCQATTKRGTRCKAGAVVGTKKCLFHNKAVRAYATYAGGKRAGMYVARKGVKALSHRFK